MKIVLMLDIKEGPSPDSGRPAFHPMILADSALTRGPKPFFIPGPPASFSALGAIAFVIGKLGKNVAPRFIPRYIREASPAVIFRDNARLDAQRGLAAPLSGAFSFDGSVHIGLPFPGELLPDDCIWSVSRPADADASPAESHFILPPGIGTDRLFSEISSYSVCNTLRTGDIFLFAAGDILDTLSPGRTHVDVHVAGRSLLSFNIL